MRPSQHRADFSHLVGMMESLVATVSLAQVPGGWGCVYCMGGSGGAGGHLGEKSDFGSVSFDSEMPVGHPRDDCLTFSFL